MSDLPTPAPARPPDPRPAVFLAGAAVVLAVAAAYALSLSGGFLYDDLDSILRNPSLDHLGTALVPPAHATVSGRPVLNLTLAANRALGGTAVWGYHAANVLIHAVAALLLLGIIRRTLATPAAGARDPGDAVRLAFGAALLWALHPLQVGSVAYVIQRGESLMGLFYLLTVYAFARSALGGSTAWAAVCVVACLNGMATKEVMVTAPVVVFLYDRVFVAGSFREAWRRRRGLHLTLAACWLPLALLVAAAGGRGGTAGPGSGIPWWAYLQAQCGAVAHYLRLAVWPHPLVGDYGRVLDPAYAGTLWSGGLLVGLGAATLVLLRRSPALGFLGAWFLLILAPSSSVIPVSTEIMADHRMYLPLAAVVLLGVLAVDRIGWRPLYVLSVTVGALGLGALTVRRTRVYAGPTAFWTDVALKVPANAGAWNNLGLLEAGRGNSGAAIADYGRALGAAPAYADAHHNLGDALAGAGRFSEAAGHYRAALKYQPDNPLVHAGLAAALARQGMPAAAVSEYREAVRVGPSLAPAWFELGNLLADSGDLPGAAQAYAAAVRLSPGFPDARVNLGNVLAQLGRLDEAAAQFREALRLQPGSADVHNNLGSLLAGSGRLPEARAEFEEALRLKPDYRDARENLARLAAIEAAGGHR